MNSGGLSRDMTEGARKLHVRLLQAFADHSGAHLSAATGLSESRISRLRNEHLEDFCRVLDAMDRKIVSREVRCYQPDIVNAWRTLAKAGIDHDAAEVE